MWKIELEDIYFKIYDDNKTLVGYFAPEYGDIQPEDKADEVIHQMIKNRSTISGGYLMVPMSKFGIFEESKEMTLEYVEQQIHEVYDRVLAWKNLITEKEIGRHKITVSHTDHDMLSITLGIVFSSPVSLDKKDILENITLVLDHAHKKNLL